MLLESQRWYHLNQPTLPEAFLKSPLSLSSVILQIYFLLRIKCYNFNIPGAQQKSLLSPSTYLFLDHLNIHVVFDVDLSHCVRQAALATICKNKT